MLKKTIIAALLFWAPESEFSLSKVAHASSEKWPLHSISSLEEQEIQAILSQPFTYGGCGAQAYVFFSEDGQSVLKLLKQKRFEIPLWMRFLPPLPYKTKKMASKRANLVKDFTSYQIAFDELQEETGLVLVHLDQTPLPYTVTLVDTDKKSHRASLGEYVFILQKRGDLVYPTVEKYMREGNMAAAKKSLTSLVQLLKGRCEKHVADRDPNFSKNYAFLGSKAIEIDIGRLSHDPVQVPQIPSDFKEWLHTLSPELHSHFENELAHHFLVVDCSLEGLSEVNRDDKPER